MSFLQPNHRAASIFEKVQKKELYTSINAYESALFQYWKTNEVLMDVVKDALDVWIGECEYEYEYEYSVKARNWWNQYQ
jgi:hypothetical protein